VSEGRKIYGFMITQTLHATAPDSGLILGL
jgi:hypothetical protein